MKIKKFTSNKQFACNLYVCSKKDKNFIIDPGFFDKSVLSYLIEKGGLDFILLTHGHFDHILGIESIIDSFPNVKIYCSNDEIDLIYNSKKNGTRLFLNHDYQPTYQVNGLFSGNNEIEGIKFIVKENPGHTQGSISYFFEEDNVLFVGDFIFLASIGRCDLPSGSEKQMYNSLIDFKKENYNDQLYIYPGHDQSFTLERIRKINPYLK